MSRFSRTIAAATTLGVAGLTAACGSDTTSPAPELLSASAEALHLDSLYMAAAVYADTDQGYADRAGILAALEVPAAYGAAPSTFLVNVGGTTQSWTGYTFETRPGDSAYLTILYDDRNATDILLTDVYLNGGLSFPSAILLAADSLFVEEDSGTATTNRIAVLASSCSLQGGLQNTSLPMYFPTGTTCNPATFSTSANFYFAPRAGVNPGFAHISFANTHDAGERFVEYNVQPDPTPLRALIDRIRARQGAGR